MGSKAEEFVYIDKEVLRSIITEASKLGAMEALIQTGSLSQYITKAVAYRRFGGRHKVTKWIESGALKVTEAGINLIDITTLASSSNLATFINSESYKNNKAG